jgi:uncharacterized repeat protein (TIGR01451 family)
MNTPKGVVCLALVLLLLNLPLAGSLTLINNCTDLQNIENDLDEDYRLNQSIDCSGTVGWNGGLGFEPIGDDWMIAFNGTLDGDNYNISDLYINRPLEDDVAIIGYTLYANIYDVNLLDINVTGRNSVGGLVGTMLYYSYIDNCYVSGRINGTNYVGGLVGIAGPDTTINHSSSSAYVTGTSHIGGLIGYTSADYGIHQAIIDNSYAIGNVSGTNNIGGLVGYLYHHSYIYRSYSSGNITGINNVGGLVGFMGYDGVVSMCYSIANVNASGDYAGGIAGYVYDWSYIDNSYAKGNVFGDEHVGGLAGILIGACNVHNSYAIGDVAGTDDVAGLVAYLSYPYGDMIDNSYATGGVLSLGDEGGLVGTLGLGVPQYGGIDNLYWNNDTDNPDDAYTGGNSNCTAIQDNESYFYDVMPVGSAPMDTWNFATVWDDVWDDLCYPPLLWENRTLIENPCDTTPPIVDWNWTDINSTITVNYTTVCVNASEEVNCTLFFNGTVMHNATVGTNICWTNESLADGNYSRINATCQDATGHRGNTTQAWVDVNTSVSYSLNKTANASAFLTGQNITWTITLNNTGLTPITVNLTDSNGRNFSNDSVANGTVWTVTYTTLANCSNITNTVNSTANNSYATRNATSSFLATVTHCGNGVCDCGETCGSCRTDCGACPSDDDDDDDSGGAITGYYWAPSGGTGGTGGTGDSGGSGDSDSGPSSSGPSSADEDEEVTITFTDGDGSPAEGEVTVTAPDGTTATLPLVDGEVVLNTDRPGTWTISYTDSEGNTVTKTVNVAGEPDEPSEPTTRPTPPAQEPKPTPKPAEDYTIYLILGAVIIVIIGGAVFFMKK